jgi:hypothetical protein
MLDGYRKRNQELWDHTRHIMLYTLQYGGMGTKKQYKASDIIQLEKDKPKKLVTTKKEALEIVKSLWPS